MRLPFDTAVKEVRDLLTPRLVAYISGVRETRALPWNEADRWAHHLLRVLGDLAARGEQLVDLAADGLRRRVLVLARA